MKSSQIEFTSGSPASAFIFTAILLLCAATGTATAESRQGTREPELPVGCARIQAPSGNKVAFHAYAAGVQIYRWNGTAWTFVAPAAILYADAGYHGQIGTHYAGPTWESNSGSKVVGQRVDGCTPDAAAIQWLLLKAVSAQRPGIFSRVSYVQRVNTVGGLAPASPGSLVGETAEVPYTAEYVFYHAAAE